MVLVAATVLAMPVVVGPADVAGAVGTPDATVANVAAPEAPPTATCDAPPEGVSASTEDCLRFVSLWSPRVADSAWLEGFLAAGALPDDIAAEGFHELDDATQGWLVAALATDLAITDVQTQSTLALVIFGQDELNELRADFNTTSPAPTPGPTASVLQPLADELASRPSAAQTLVPSPPSPEPPATSQMTDLVGGVASEALGALMAGPPVPQAATTELAAPPAVAASAELDANSLLQLVIGAVNAPPLSDLTGLVTQLLGAVADIQQQLFAVPGLNILGGLTYRVCAQSPTQQLACSINLPVAVPIPVDVTGDVVPDVLAHLAPVVGVPTIEVVSLLPPRIKVTPVTDVGFTFRVQRLFPNAGPLPAHVFAVYDPPTLGKRVQFGYDARESTLARVTQSTVTLVDILEAVKGDIEIEAEVTHTSPGAAETLTAAVKQLVPQQGGLPLERDPVVAAVRFSPVPTELTANAHLQHFGGKNQDTISLDSNASSVVTALLTQDVNTVSPASHREFSVHIDRLPEHVTVDLLNQNPQQVVTYDASSVIDHVHVTQKSVDDTSHPGTFTSNDVDVLELPENVQLTLTGSEDVLYSASSEVPQVQFVTERQVDSVLQNQIVATANGIPQNVHLSNVTTGDTSTVSYDADASLDSLALGMYDRPNDETVINASAQSLPLEMQLVQTKSTGATDYTASGPIGVIEATLSRAGGATIPLPDIDHATVQKVGDAIGLDLRLSGLAGAHIDPSEQASYGLQLSPGGQPFEAIAELDDPNRAAHVTISNLPSSIQLDLDPVGGEATYTASSVIDSIDARYDQLDAGTVGHVVLEAIPTTLSATWETGGSTPALTYAADGRLGSISAFYQEAPGATSFYGSISDLPLFMSIEGVESLTFDARSAADAAPASDHVGQLVFRYGSDGVLPMTGNSNDHLYLSSSGDVTNAEIVYSGLELLRAATAGDELHVRVENTEPRRFDVDVVTPEMEVSAFIDQVPDMVQVDMVGEHITYTASSPINEIAASVDRLNGDLVNLDIRAVPTSIDLEFDSAASTVEWDASEVTGEISAAAQFGPTTTGTSRTFNAGLQILGIPAAWSASYAGGHVLFDGESSAIGQITARFTNHGAVTTVAGDGVSAVFDAATGDLDAYLRISQLDRAEFEKVAASGTGAGGFDADLDMGTGAPFAINADIRTADGTVLTAQGSISNLPTEMRLRAVDGVVSYQGNSHPTLDLDVAYGQAAAVAATPAPPAPHGVAVRDGSSGGNDAIRASLFLTGLPTDFTFDTLAGVYTVNGFDPSIDPLTLDVALDDFVATPVTLLVQQTVGDGPVNFTFGPFTSATAEDGAKTIHASYSASRQMGALTGDVTMGGDMAHLLVSNIPTSMTLDVRFGDATKSMTITLGEPVAEITANYKRTSDGAFTAGATLTDVPTSVNLLLGEQGDAAGVQVPVFSYNADAATLDIQAFLADAVFGPASDAGFELDVVNLGNTVAGNLTGTKLTLGSTPATDSFTLVAHASLNFGFSLDFDAGPFVNDGDLAVNLDVDNLTVGFTDMSSLVLDLGFSTGISGDYGTFTFGEESNTSLHITIDLDLDLGTFGTYNLVPDGDGHRNIDLDLGNVIGNFRLADDHKGPWLDIFTPITCPVPPFFVHAIVELRPHPHSTTNGPTFTVNGGGPGWVATVNPLGVVPDLVLDFIARFTTPFTGDEGLTATCEFL